MARLLYGASLIVLVKGSPVAHYNLYETLKLDRNQSSAVLAEIIEEKRKTDVYSNPGGLEELNIAQAVLGNGFRKTIYDRQLQNPDAPEITISALRQLAKIQVSTEQHSVPQSAGGSWVDQQVQSVYKKPKEISEAHRAAVKNERFVGVSNISIMDNYRSMPVLVKLTTWLFLLSAVISLVEIVLELLLPPETIVDGKRANLALDLMDSFGSEMSTRELNAILALLNWNDLDVAKYAVELYGHLIVLFMAILSFLISIKMFSHFVFPEKSNRRQLFLQITATLIVYAIVSVVLFVNLWKYYTPGMIESPVWLFFIIFMLSLVVCYMKVNRMWLGGKVPVISLSETTHQ